MAFLRKAVDPAVLLKHVVVQPRSAVAHISHVIHVHQAPRYFMVFGCNWDVYLGPMEWQIRYVLMGTLWSTRDGPNLSLQNRMMVKISGPRHQSIGSTPKMGLCENRVSHGIPKSTG